jgi:aryl-alcohol dehydrogenase-like predicted oxidoreductase
MEKRRLGRSTLEIAPLVFGGNVFGWTVDEKTAFKLLDAFVAAGLNCIDTADVYSTWVPGHLGGESETVIGRWLKRRGGRDKVIIATKVGSPMGDGRQGLSAANIALAAEASLQRLQTDYIDLYQSHIDDVAAPLEATLRAYSDLIDQGKVRAIGASNYTASRLREALETSYRLGLPRYESLQPLYNLTDRFAFEGELEALCAEQQVGVICYYALASGFLTGKYRSEADLAQSARGSGVKRYLDARGVRILKALDAVSQRLGATPAQVALAWLMARPTVTAPIASATTLEQLEELVGALRIKLDDDALMDLNSASRPAPG